MIRLGSLVGLPAALEGRMVGRVEQTVLTSDGRYLRGLVIRHGMGGAKWAGRESICLLGEVSVILLARPGRMPEGADFTLTGVKDSDGLNLGRVTDAYVNPRTFRVVALEISLGLVEELTCGRMLARSFAVSPAPVAPGQVILPGEGLLERAPAPGAVWREVER